MPGRAVALLEHERAAHPLGELVGDREAEARALAAAGPAVEAVEQPAPSRRRRSAARRRRRPARRWRRAASTDSVTSTPSGLCRSALSTSARATCATRASSAIADRAGRPAAPSPMRRAARRRRRSPRRPARRRSSRSTSSCATATPPASRRDRSSRSVARRVRRDTWPCIVATNSRRALGILLVLEQLEEAAEREQRRAQLVRGVRDELAPRPVGALEPPPHVVEGPRQLVDLVAAVVDDRRREVAGGDAPGGPLQPADAGRQRVGREQADQPRHRQRDRRRRSARRGCTVLDRAVDVVQRRQEQQHDLAGPVRRRPDRDRRLGRVALARRGRRGTARPSCAPRCASGSRGRVGDVPATWRKSPRSFSVCEHGGPVAGQLLVDADGAPRAVVR